MPKIELYSTPSCSKCMLTENILNGLEYSNIKDTSVVIDKAKELDIMEMPILVVGEKTYSGSEAIIKAKSLKEELSA